MAIYIVTEFKTYYENKSCKPMFAKKISSKGFGLKKIMQKKLPTPPSPQTSDGPSLVRYYVFEEFPSQKSHYFARLNPFDCIVLSELIKIVLLRTES